MRIGTLNLNHRTRAIAVPTECVEHLALLELDTVILTEYVPNDSGARLLSDLSRFGFDSVAVSESEEYRPGRWHNQILIASKNEISHQIVPNGGPDSMSRTNTLTVETFGVRITGLRVPAYTNAGDWYSYWDWLPHALDGDVAIGDFNANPDKENKWHRVLEKLENEGGWYRPLPKGHWSYRGANGKQSKVDHILVRNAVRVLSADYVPEPFVPRFTDHAALVAELFL